MTTAVVRDGLEAVATVGEEVFTVDEFGQLESGRLGGVEWFFDRDTEVGYLRLPPLVPYWDGVAVMAALKGHGWYCVDQEEFFEFASHDITYTRLERRDRIYEWG